LGSTNNDKGSSSTHLSQCVQLQQGLGSYNEKGSFTNSCLSQCGQLQPQGLGSKPDNDQGSHHNTGPLQCAQLQQGLGSKSNDKGSYHNTWPSQCAQLQPQGLGSAANNNKGSRYNTGPLQCDQLQPQGLGSKEDDDRGSLFSKAAWFAKEVMSTPSMSSTGPFAFLTTNDLDMLVEIKKHENEVKACMRRHLKQEIDAMYRMDHCGEPTA